MYFWASEVAQQAKALATEVWPPEFSSQTPCRDGREQTQQSCSLHLHLMEVPSPLKYISPKSTNASSLIIFKILSVYPLQK